MRRPSRVFAHAMCHVLWTTLGGSRQRPRVRRPSISDKLHPFKFEFVLACVLASATRFSARLLIKPMDGWGLRAYE